MCLNGVKLHAFLLEVSRLLEEAIAQDDDPREPAYEPGGARHVPVDKAGDTARDGRWTRWVKWSTRSTRSDMIDAYRDLFLVKHPSRGAMLAETKRVLAYRGLHTAVSEQWLTLLSRKPNCGACRAATG